MTMTLAEQQLTGINNRGQQVYRGNGATGVKTNNKLQMANAAFGVSPPYLASTQKKGSTLGLSD